MHPAMQDDALAKLLLADVLGNSILVESLFSVSPAFDAASLTQWDDLRAEMMHINRWFLENQVDFDRLSELLNYLIADPATLSAQWHRARILEDDEMFSLEKMGAPPSSAAGHGRANPAGIPYLYLGSTPSTAVAEIRPHTGEAACVAEFRLPNLRVVDLRAPRTRVSPFTLGDDAIGQMHADLPLLERLGSELTRPILPRGAPFEYIPSQYLCEFIKSCGFDGVMYRSSVSDGINVALFNPNVALPTRVIRYAVDRVEVHVSEVV